MSDVQLIEQCLSLLQVARVEAFGKPAVDRSEQVASLLRLALVAPEAREAHGGAEFPGFGLLLRFRASGYFFRSILTSADATAASEQLVRVREPLENYSRYYASASLSTRSSITSAASQGLFAWYLMID